MTDTSEVLRIIDGIGTPTDVRALRHLFRGMTVHRLRAILQTLSDLRYVNYTEDYAWRCDGTRSAIEIMNRIDSSWRDSPQATDGRAVQFTVCAMA